MTEDIQQPKVPGALPSNARYVGTGYSDRYKFDGQDHRSSRNWEMEKLPQNTNRVYLVSTDTPPRAAGIDVKVDKSFASDPTLIQGIVPHPSLKPGDVTASFEFNSDYQSNYYSANPYPANGPIHFQIWITTK